MPVPRHRPTPPDRGFAVPDEFPVLTSLAFYLLLAVVASRVLLSEYVRDPMRLPDAPRGAGAATMIWLDLACCIPALLVLIRRAIDKFYVLRLHLSHIPLAGLAIWSAASVTWASDKYAALFAAANWIAALVILWSATQLVRSWQRLRVVAGLLVGLLLCLCAQGIFYRAIDVPDLQQAWQTEGPKMLAAKNWSPDSFEAKQFEKKVLAGEVFGFSTSPNSYAAQLVMLGIACLSLVIQRRRDGDESGWVGAAALPILPAIVLPYYTGSKTALATAAIGVVGLLLAIRFAPTLARRRARAFLMAGGVLVLGIAAVGGHGLYHGRLPSASLNFRWSYWVGSAKLMTERPLTGTGWGNFGSAYLMHRLPRATEEIKDPHNFVLSIATQLGLVGLVLFLCWVIRLAYEATRPVTLADTAAAPPVSGEALYRLAMTCGAMFAITAVAGIDFSGVAGIFAIDVLKRLAFAALLLVGMLVASLRQESSSIVADDRPAPVLKLGLLVACGILLLHASVDFALFEIGGSLLFATIAGSLGGVASISHAGRTRRIVGPRAIAGAAALTWIAAAVLIAVPITVANEAGHQADELLAQRPADAAQRYEQAFVDAPVANAEYLARRAEALTAAQATPGNIRIVLARRITADPRDPGGYLDLARFEASLPSVDVAAVLSNLRTAVRLNPQELSIRLSLADAAMRAGRTDEAVANLRAALATNDAMDAAEPERLRPEQVDQVRALLARLRR